MKNSDLISSILWLIFAISISFVYIGIDEKHNATSITISAIERGLIQCVEKVGDHDKLIWKKECN